MASEEIAFRVHRLKQRHNPDYDQIPGAPRVTWADRELLGIVEALEERIEILEVGVKPDFGRFALWLAQELTSDEARRVAQAAEAYIERAPTADGLAASLEAFLDTLGGMGCLKS